MKYLGSLFVLFGICQVGFASLDKLECKASLLNIDGVSSKVLTFDDSGARLYVEISGRYFSVDDYTQKGYLQLYAWNRKGDRANAFSLTPEKGGKPFLNVKFGDDLMTLTCK